MTRKKLIEVALPLEAINAASAREKSIRHGHPSTLHLWWARRPLAACRAVLFAQLVDDPSSVPEEFPDEAAQEKERQRLFRIVEELVKWESSNDRRVIAAARREIARSAARAQGEAPPRTKAEVDAFLAEKTPPVLDPFCGGGSIPLEAQRLGLRTHGSDLNPVAVLITKALVEIPSRFADLPPANPEAQARFARGAVWNGKGAAGLAEINRVLDETLAEAEGDMDADTRFCVAWFEQYGTAERAYGEAEVLFTAKNTSFAGLREAGVIGGGGKVRLKRRDELDLAWDPARDERLVDWECAQHLVRAMTAETGGGVAEAAHLTFAMGHLHAENARALAYRLYTVSERKGWTQEALACNILATSWPQIQAKAAELAADGLPQAEMGV